MLANIILGHLVGDYLLQNDWMALNKSKRNLFGWLTCTVHCIVYSAAVCLFTKWNFLWFCLVFLTHIFIDHYALAEWWTKMKGNQKLSDYMTSKTAGQGWARTEQVTSSFKSIVYVVQDNTMHLVLMYFCWLIFM